MKLYICGPMTGLPNHNFPTFDAAKEELESRGHTVISPADIDRNFGLSGAEHPGSIAIRLIQEIMLVELRAILDCDALVTLPGWEASTGVATEIAWATQWGIPVMHNFIGLNSLC